MPHVNNAGSSDKNYELAEKAAMINAYVTHERPWAVRLAMRAVRTTHVQGYSALTQGDSD